ncbi:histidine kinase [Dactylosporangium sp. NBC_01737]|uniref:sensor histidine kinase n=1 Tax=Dactylosporangium sp. NBC_01737 TaxID=2975959 RepID=UPI002E12FD13|nr:histidine kinase [Dactylosporangium sp. NBC_01737]
MGGGRSRAAGASALAWAFPTVFLCLLLPARIGVAVGLGTGLAGAFMAAALFGLPLLYTIPRGRRLWDAYTWPLLTAQAVLTYVPFLVFGGQWAVGLSGLLGGLLLLTVAPRVSWLLLATIVAVEAVLRLAVFGVYPEGGAQFVSWVFVVPIDMALPLFGLVRLSSLVAELRLARTELADAAVTEERLRTAARLRATVGDRLEAVTAHAGAALAALGPDPDRARAHLAEAARVARQATEQVRQTVVADPAGRTEPPTPWRVGITVAPRLALLVLVVDLGAFAGHHLVVVADEFDGGPAVTAGVGVIAVVAALQAYHSLGIRAGRRPRAWAATLAVQVLLPIVVIAVTFADKGTSLVGMVGFPAGSLLLLVPGRWAWLCFTAVVASVSVPRALLYPDEAPASVYFMGLVASTGLAVYGLSRLPELAEELAVARQELTRAAADAERLRAARDAHDLLGLGLSVAALKCDLAGRLIGRDNAGARDELEALVRLTTQTRADIQAVTTGEPALSLRAELGAARKVLASAGIDVDARIGPAAETLPAEADALLATVLREAIANVLRHAMPAQCEIDLSTRGDEVVLRVSNDGVAAVQPNRQPARPVEPVAGGRGLSNLTARVASVGGGLAASTEDGRFTLDVRAPLPPAPAGRPIGLADVIDPAAP